MPSFLSQAEDNQWIYGINPFRAIKCILHQTCLAFTYHYLIIIIPNGSTYTAQFDSF